MNSTSHIGAVGELFACNYFMSHGLEVCRNVAASGPVDIMLFNKHNSKSIALDIKSYRSPYIRVDGTLSLGKQICLRNDGVWQVAYVHGETSLRLPEGFWEALGMDGCS